MSTLRIPLPSRAMTVASLAVLLNVASVAYAATGGTFVLGKSNSATSQTTLTANIGGRALQVTNTSTLTGSTPLSLTAASGKPPLIVNSGTKVTNLNADRLDGLDSSQFQRPLKSCTGNQAVAGVTQPGLVTCVSIPHPQVVTSRTVSGPFPASLGSFVITQTGVISIQFAASGFSPTATKQIGAELIICTAAPCSAPNALSGIYALSQTFTNDANSHKTMVTGFGGGQLTAGTYYLNVVPLANTVMDANDIANWQIIQYS
jgi:hypothetical protein